LRGTYVNTRVSRAVHIFFLNYIAKAVTHSVEVPKNRECVSSIHAHDLRLSPARTELFRTAYIVTNTVGTQCRTVFEELSPCPIIKSSRVVSPRKHAFAGAYGKDLRESPNPTLLSVRVPVVRAADECGSHCTVHSKNPGFDPVRSKPSVPRKYRHFL
jgi:hypothetical protein